jgi:hypothetical protein
MTGLGHKRDLRALVAESPHRVTCVAPSVLLANISDEHVRALYLNFESSDQRIFCVNNNVFRFPLTSEANSKLHVMLSILQYSHVMLSILQYSKASIMPISARSSDVLTGYAPVCFIVRDSRRLPISIVRKQGSAIGSQTASAKTSCRNCYREGPSHEPMARTR